MNIAVIGAGVTGSLVAAGLTESGHDVVVLEKSRGKGGRCCFKRTEWGSFNIGAPVIPASDRRFIQFMQQQVKSGIARRLTHGIMHFSGHFQADDGRREYFVFTPGMNAGCRSWLEGIEVVTGFRAEHLQRTPKGWLVWDKDARKYGVFDWVVVTAPWPQTAMLLAEQGVADPSDGTAHWRECQALALQLADDPGLPADIIYTADTGVQCWSRQSDSEASGHPVWLVHFDHQVSEQMVTAEAGDLIKRAGASLEQMGLSMPQVLHHYHHRWRYARPDAEASPLGIVHHPELVLSAAGDWSFGGSVQAAFLASEACLGYFS